MDNDKKALQSGVWYTISNFLVKSIGFITTPIFTRLLSKEEFGLYNNYTSWLSILSIFITLNLESTLISARYEYKDDFDNYIFSMLCLSSLSTVIWFILFHFLSDFVVEYTSVDHIYLNVMLVYLFFFPAITMFQMRERYFFEYKKTVVISLLLAASTALLSVVLVLAVRDRLWGRITGSVIPTIILGLLIYLFLGYKARRFKLAYWKYALPICLPYIPHLLAGVLLNSMDRIMIQRWCGSEATAMYSLAYSCGAIVALLVNSLNSAYAPWLGEKLSQNNYKEIYDFSKKYIYFFLIFSIGIMLIAPEILWFLGGDTYRNAKYVITPVAMGCVCQFLYTMFGNVEQFKKKTIGMASATVIAAAINYILNYLMIPRFGYFAAAYTTLVGYLCLLGMHMFLVFKIGLKTVYSYKYVLGAVLLGILFMFIITLTYEFLSLRLMFIALYVFLLFLLFSRYKNRVISIIKNK